MTDHNNYHSSEEYYRDFGEGRTAHHHCDECAEMWSDFMELRELGKSLPNSQPLPEQREQVRAQILAQTHMLTGTMESGRRSRFIWGAAIAAAILLLLGFVMIMAQSRKPVDSGATHAVKILRGTIYPHDGAEYLVLGSQPDEMVRLLRGTITVEVSPLEAGERFRVITGDGEVEVKGTVFDVTAENDALQSVSVMSGKVEVRPVQLAVATLFEGDRWTRPLKESSGMDTVEAGQAECDALDSGSHDSLVEQEQDTLRSTSRRRLRPPKTVTQVPKKPAAGPAEIAFNRGWDALKQGDYETATREFDKTTTLGGNNRLGEDASYWRAVALGRTGYHSRAVKAFRQFIETYPKSPRRGEAATMLGWKLFDQGKLDEAQKLFSSAKTDKAPRVRESAKKGLAKIAAMRK